MKSFQGCHLSKVVPALLVVVFVLYGQALLTSRVLTQADLLLTFPPWKQHQPNDFAGPSNALLSDQSFQVLPYLYYLKQSISEGRIPLWNPHIMAGMPFLSNMQSGVFYPLHWLVLLRPVPEAVEWICATKVLLAALGFYLFSLKVLAVGPIPAFGGAVIYALCGFNTVWLFYAHTNVALLAGWLLLAIDGVIRRGRLENICLLALVVALAIFAGHPETALHLSAVAALFIAFQLGRAATGRPAALGRISLATLLGTALSGVVLLPFMDDGLASATLAIRKYAEHPSLPWFSAVTALIPDFFGNPSAGFYRGPKNYNEIASFASVSSLVLAGLALALGRRNPGTYFGLATSALCGVVAYGIAPFFQIFHLLPLYGHSLNTRLVLGVSLGLAILSAVGLNVVLKIEGRKVWRRIRRCTSYAAAAAILVLAPFIAAVLARLGGERAELQYVSAQVVWFFLTVGVLLGLMSWLVRCPGQRRRVCLLWVLLICVEMIHFAWGYNPAIPRARYAYDRLPESIRFLQSRGLDRYVGVTFGELAPNASMVYGIFDFRGYDFPEPMLYNRYFYSLVDASNPLNLTHSIDRWTPQAVRALGDAGVRYFVHERAIDYPGMRLVHAGDMNIYEYEHALPRVYLPRRIAAVQTAEEAFSQMKAPEFDARATALVVLGDGESLPPPAPEG
ncbi:MAG: hypothetical protein HYX74_09175, partial [Acidobacteria bacterium]|nr:hypothetical protein [Acidobacteriota bacterium]